MVESLATLARAFDMPVDSPEHRELAENGWVGGDFISVRYWLGRLLNRNLFRETDDSVTISLQDYLVDRGCHAGASLVSDRQAWGPVAILLRHDLEAACGYPSTGNSRFVAALDAVLANPELTNAELARLANTTEKQVKRMTDVSLVRKLWNCQRSQLDVPRGSEDRSMSSELHELSERWFGAWLTKDAATVERLAAPDYLYVGPNGSTLDRQAILKIIRSPSYRLDRGTRTNVVVRPLGPDAALVRHHYQGSGSFEGTSFTDDQWCVMVWEKQAGQWRLVMEQCSDNTV
jgi:uncharacterized protein (TIGR02246 family)